MGCQDSQTPPLGCWFHVYLGARQLIDDSVLLCPTSPFPSGLWPLCHQPAVCYLLQQGMGMLPQTLESQGRMGWREATLSSALQ